MKKTIHFFLLCFISISAIAQNDLDSISNRYEIVDHSQIKTIFGSNHSKGGYLGLDMFFGEIKNQGYFEIGSRLAWIVDHRFAFGVQGSGFATTDMIDLDNIIAGNITEISLIGGYGGFLFEPIIMPLKPIHLSVPILCGIGGAETYSNIKSYDIDAFFVFRPGVEAEINLFRFMRVAVGGHYRYLYDMNLKGFEPDDLNGLAFSVSFKFGIF